MTNKKSIEERIAWLWQVNQENSKVYVADTLPRLLYKAKHETSIYGFMCMDGRVSISHVTGMPLGIIEPYRNLGSQFDLGWYALGAEVQDLVEKNVALGRKSIFLINYHYSGSDLHKGCAGFDHNKEISVKFMIDLKNQFDRIFGKNNGVVYPIVLGLETDTESLIFHAEDPSSEKVLFLNAEMNTTEDYLVSLINDLYPHMSMDVKKDLIPLIQGNIEHIKKNKENGRKSEDLVHGEWVLGVGRGFNWLHELNTALIVGPYNPDLSVPISKALSIIAKNMKSEAILNDGFLVLLSALYEKDGYDKNRAIEKANFFGFLVKKIIENNFLELKDKVRFMRVVVNKDTRQMEEFKEFEAGL